MLWNKARRPATSARPNVVRPITPPGTTWPTTPPSQPTASARPPAIFSCHREHRVHRELHELKPHPSHPKHNLCALSDLRGKITTST
ncbi:DUF1589 domain-containing protein [Rhodopirellula baltica]|uniref:DUF1589 domain-containing protein n=1 Tax=Rhodopirellula baltica TaxID=265606 RepID=UPI0036F1BC64